MTGAYNPGSKFRLSSPYDWRIDPLTGDKKEFHPGQDFSARAGTPIPAATSGTVVYSGFNKGFGNVVIVKNDTGSFNDTGSYSLYGHMHAGDRAALGQRIGQGDILGLVGSTGSSTGPHLHYSIIRAGPGKMIEKTPGNGGSIGIHVNRKTTIDPAGYVDYHPSPRYLEETSRAAQLMSGIDANAASSGIQIDSGNTIHSAWPDKYDRKPLYLDETSRAARIMSGTDTSATFGNRPSDHQNLFDDRFRRWGSVPVASPSQPGSDLPGLFNDRFGNWGSAPADDSENSRSPIGRALRDYRRSMAPDGPASSSAQDVSSATPAYRPDAGYLSAGDSRGSFPNVAAAGAALSPAAFNTHASSSDPRTLSEAEALLQSLARLASGAGQFVRDSLVSPAEATPLPRIASGPTAPDLPGDEAPVTVKKRGPYLSSQVVYPSQATPGDATVPATSDVQDQFSDRFGDWVASPAGSVPRGPDQPPQTPKTTAPTGLLTGEPMPRDLLPHWLLGLQDPSKASGDGAEDWINLLIRPYREQ